MRSLQCSSSKILFQHTAARRRLPLTPLIEVKDLTVSTHSRAEAAAIFIFIKKDEHFRFQHTAARRRLLPT